MKDKKASFVAVTLLVTQLILIILVGGIIKGLDLQSKRLDRLEIQTIEVLVKHHAF